MCKKNLSCFFVFAALFVSPALLIETLFALFQYQMIFAKCETEFYHREIAVLPQRYSSSLYWD